MHGRTRFRHLALGGFVLVAACLGACATAPPSRPDTPAIRALREDYLRAFPDGANNEHIKRGEVVRGMSLYEVLASWGIPDARVVSVKGNQERWVYVLLDDLSLDWICYEYEFRNNALIDWTTTREVANGFSLDTPKENPGTLNLPAWATQSQHGGAPVK